MQSRSNNKNNFMAYPSEEVKEFMLVHKDHLTNNDVAQAFAITPSKVNEFTNHLGIKMLRNTECDMLFVAELKLFKTAEAVADHLHLPLSIVKIILRRIGIMPGEAYAGPVSAAVVKDFLVDYGRHLTAEEVVERFGVLQSSVSIYCKEAGVKLLRKQNGITKVGVGQASTQVKNFITSKAKYMALEDVAEEFDLPISEVEATALQLGITMLTPRQRDVKFIERMYGQMTLARICKTVKRTEEEVRGILDELGLVPPEKFPQAMGLPPKRPLTSVAEILGNFQLRPEVHYH